MNKSLRVVLTLTAWAGLVVISPALPWWMFLPVAVVLGWSGGAFIDGDGPFERFAKETRDGPDRQAEEGDQHPGAFQTGGTITFPSAGTYAITQHISFGGPKPAERADEGAVEHVEEDMPILAHRAALLTAGVGGPRFCPMTKHGGPFGIDAVAACSSHEARLVHAMTARGEPHGQAPNIDCTCGYYAVPLAEPLPYPNDPHIDLLVELSGTVIEHEHGYRAEHQRVVEARIPGCEMCGRETHSLRYESWGTRCVRHLPTDQPYQWVAVEALPAALGVPVTALEATR